jgi:hypothetical protein
VIRSLLTDVHLPDCMPLPLDPGLFVKELVVDKCKTMQSETVPLWLTFVNEDVCAGNCCVIFKVCYCCLIVGCVEIGVYFSICFRFVICLLCFCDLFLFIFIFLKRKKKRKKKRKRTNISPTSQNNNQTKLTKINR